MSSLRFSAAAIFCIQIITASAALAQTPSAPTQSPSIAAPAKPALPPATTAPPATQSANTTAAASADAEPIGNVATLNGSATVTRNNATSPLKLKDDVYKNDVLKTAANSKLGVTFNDETTFNLTANAQIAIDDYVYENGGKKNAALFNIAQGTVAFVAAAVAKTGDMKIATPTSTLGIRGTTGLVEVPQNATAATNPNNVAIKLYSDPDGHVGRIEINDRAGARLGALSQTATGFTVQRGIGPGARFAAVPLTISPQQVARDQGFVRQVHATQGVGRQIVTQQRTIRQNNRTNPARPGLNRPTNAPTPNGRPTPNGQPQRNGQQQPGLPAGQPNRANAPVNPTQPATAAPAQQQPRGAALPGVRPEGQIRAGGPRRPGNALRLAPKRGVAEKKRPPN